MGGARPPAPPAASRLQRNRCVRHRTQGELRPCTLTRHLFFAGAGLEELTAIARIRRRWQAGGI